MKFGLGRIIYAIELVKVDVGLRTDVTPRSRHGGLGLIRVNHFLIAYRISAAPGGVPGRSRLAHISEPGHDLLPQDCFIQQLAAPQV